MPRMFNRFGPETGTVAPNSTQIALSNVVCLKSSRLRATINVVKQAVRALGK